MAQELRILFAGGGTGGHLYPGLAVARQVTAMVPEAHIAFVATRKAIDRRLLESGPYAARFEDTRGFSSRPWHWPGFAIRLITSMRRARAYLAEFRPQAVVGLGGYGSYPAVREAQKLHLPTFVLNPDLIPGRANRWLAARATVVFCQFPETVGHLRCGGRVEVLGCPLREELFGVRRDEAVSVLGLDPERKTLAVTGASSGARSVNMAVVRLADRLAQLSGWQVLHLTGRDLFEEVRRALGGDRPNYHLLDYVDDMGRVYAAADLAIARAGAGTVAEITALGLPSVLMPYPFHRDRHQERHARALADGGAAVMVLDQVDAERNAEALWDVLSELMTDNDRRARMADAARRLGHPAAARSVAAAVISAVGQIP